MSVAAYFMLFQLNRTFLKLSCNIESTAEKYINFIQYMTFSIMTLNITDLIETLSIID